MIVGNYIEIDGIKVFNDDIREEHQDYNAKGLDSLFLQEEKHFWFIARKEFICRQIEQFIPKPFTIIDVGAGTGNVSRYLKHNGYESICVGEMHLNGLYYAKRYGIEKCYQFDLLRVPFENEFDAVCMFDVLEHIDDDVLALQNVHKMLNDDGYVILTVPAHMWLWNRDDTIASHKRRYDKKGLVEKLEMNGFEVLNARYFFMTITPLLFLRRLLHSDNKDKVSNEEYIKGVSINRILSVILLFVSRVENKLNKILPNWFGGSLLVIAQKYSK